jgi:hypothetical protein
MLLIIVLVYCSWRFLPSAPRALLLGLTGSGTGDAWRDEKTMFKCIGGCRLPGYFVVIDGVDGF